MSMRILNVSEKPSVAKGISEILSSGRFKVNNGKSKYNKIYTFPYEVDGRRAEMVFTSVSGHIKNLVLSSYENNWNVDPVLIFDVPLLKVTLQCCSDIEKTLQMEARRAELLILWLDCDREGENIAFEVIDICKGVNGRLKILRAHFSAVIPTEICSAMSNLKSPDKNQSDAVDARQEMDLRIGYAFTRYQTKRWRDRFKFEEDNEQPISFGTCQFPTLGFVVDRYWKRIHFRPEDYWFIELVLKKEGQKVVFNWNRNRIFDYISCVVLYEMMMNDLESRPAMVTRVERKMKRKWKPYPLSTVELQKVVSRRYKMLTQRVMQVAEKLYQRGLISYPRTETDSFPRGFDFDSLIGKQRKSGEWGAYAMELQDNGKFSWPRVGKHDDKSHPPIYPTRYQDLQKFDNEEERNVYEFIVRHFLACCSEDAVGDETRVEVMIGCEKFHCVGLNVTQMNYLAVYPYQKWSENCIPGFDVDEHLVPESVKMVEGRTTAPHLLTEADLIQLMNKNGIGTDATMAEHINTIIKRRYVTRNAKSELAPTKLGEALIAGYNYAGFRSLNQPQLRAELESSLKSIAEGSVTREAVIKENVIRYREYYLDLVSKSNILDQAISRYYPSKAEGGGTR